MKKSNNFIRLGAISVKILEYLSRYGNAWIPRAKINLDLGFPKSTIHDNLAILVGDKLVSQQKQINGRARPTLYYSLNHIRYYQYKEGGFI